MNKDLLKGLTKEQIEKIKACKDSEEILSLAKEEGIELTDEQLAVINGGSCLPSFIDPFDCPKCGCDNITKDGREYECNKCHYVWVDNTSPI